MKSSSKAVFAATIGFSMMFSSLSQAAELTLNSYNVPAPYARLELPCGAVIRLQRFQESVNLIFDRTGSCENFRVITSEKCISESMDDIKRNCPSGSIGGLQKTLPQAGYGYALPSLLAAGGGYLYFTSSGSYGLPWEKDSRDIRVRVNFLKELSADSKTVVIFKGQKIAREIPLERCGGKISIKSTASNDLSYSISNAKNCSMAYIYRANRHGTETGRNLDISNGNLIGNLNDMMAAKNPVHQSSSPLDPDIYISTDLSDFIRISLPSQE